MNILIILAIATPLALACTLYYFMFKGLKDICDSVEDAIIDTQQAFLKTIIQNNPKHQWALPYLWSTEYARRNRYRHNRWRWSSYRRKNN